MLKRWIPVLLATLLPLSPAAAEPAEFVVRDARTRLVEQVYLLDAYIEYEFSPEILEALGSGVPITISLDIEVERKGPWWWIDEDIAALEQRYRINYYALSDQFLLRNVNSGGLYAYPTLDSVLDALGRIDDLPLLDENLVKPGERYEVDLRARLDIESLPSPLRPLAYVSPGWRLASDWFSCSLTR